MIFFARKSHWILLGLGIACLLGCGRDDGKIWVQGSVSWNGIPIHQGYIELQPDAGQGQIVGADIVDGEFTLAAMPGNGRVSIRAQKQIGMTEPTERIPTPEPILFQYLPSKFNTESELSFSLNPNDTRLAFDLAGEALIPSMAEDAKRRKQQGVEG